MREVDIYEGVNKVTLVPAGAGVGKKGKGAGFYCESCNLTFKDSIQYMDHLNSKQHLDNTGQSTKVERASLADVKARLEMLAAKIEKPYNIHEAIAKAQEQER
ncbi:U4/U6.U5 small nuclear ribonucleoprotein component snu23 [Wickerhamiella sorbophila]|uniref:U4/U6.U5 small nuclear ribonucleoprotein component snu23 n=1 Tax=Wickerhamiella sorbophila TaxID=45607 RepID=A0A2T0FPU6_9ASCO|nr:U4/U6.U5 small nuclear ribonucleoprotein component snu23 [Wickerhamiella sorbophila]PRT57008.1 U4/U6.U5 small nuclear ribonucleoprotein component snu23 [Wickerhamiella sorbophila]